MNNANLPLHYIGQIQQYLESNEIDTKSWLKQVNLSAEDVIQDQKLLTYEQYEKLILSAIALSGQPHMGLMLGKRLSINTHGALGLALLSCQNIRQVLSVFERFVTTRTPLVAIELDDQMEHLHIIMHERVDLSHIRACFFEVMAVTIDNILNTVLPEKSVLLRIEFPFERPEYAAKYTQTFCCQTEFDAPQAILVLDKNSLDAPLVHADEHAFYQAKQMCEAELQRVINSGSLAWKIKSLLMNSREHFLSLEQVSSALNLTPRTLHRRLIAEGTSFKMILEEVRAVLAKQYIISHRQSTKQVAYNLGYSDVANFRRAFKRWYGISPSELRNQ
ncbi:MAG: AraC family transcriptional regulator [Aliiglaciecola sp.]